MTRAAERAPLLPMTAAHGERGATASALGRGPHQGVDDEDVAVDDASRRVRARARGVKVALVIGSAAAVCAVAFASVSARGHDARLAGLGRFRNTKARRAALARTRRNERAVERHALARAEAQATQLQEQQIHETEEAEVEMVDAGSDVQKMIREAIARVRGTPMETTEDVSEDDVGHSSGDDPIAHEKKHKHHGDDDDERAVLATGDHEALRRRSSSKKSEGEDSDEDYEDEDYDDEEAVEKDAPVQDSHKSQAFVRKHLENPDDIFAKIEFKPYKAPKRASAEVRASADTKLAELAERSNALLLEIAQRMNTRIESIQSDADKAEDINERLQAQEIASEKIEELREEVRKRVFVIKQKTAMRAAAIKDEIEAEIKDNKDAANDDDDDDDTAQLASGGNAADDNDSQTTLTPHKIDANIDALKNELAKQERVKENIENLHKEQRKRKEAVEDRQERIEDKNSKEKKNKEAAEDRKEEHEEKYEAAEDEATAAMLETLKKLRVALHVATGEPLNDIKDRYQVPTTLSKLKENDKWEQHQAKDAKEDEVYEEKIESMKTRIENLERELDFAVNGHEFDPEFFRKRPVGLEPDFPAEHSYDESGGFFQCETENMCMTKVTLYKHKGKLYGMKGHCQKGTKATDLGTSEHEVFPKHAEFDFSANQCDVDFDKHYRSLYIRREGDDVIAMSTDGTPATRCGADLPTATSVKYECQNPKACITGFHVKNRYTNIDGNVKRTAEDLSISDVDFICSDGKYAIDPLLLRDDYGQISVTPQFTVGVALTPSPAGARKTVTPYLQLKTHSVVSANVGQENMLVTQIRDITRMSDEQRSGWCTTQHVQAWLNSAPSCANGSTLCAKSSFLYNPPGAEYRLKYGHQLFNVTNADTHESTHIVLTNNQDPTLEGHLPVKMNEEFFKFGHVYEICASAVDYSGFTSNITNDLGEVVGTMAHRRLDGDARFVGLSHSGELSVSMKGGARHYIAHAPEAPTEEQLEALGCAGDSSCVISGGGGSSGDGDAKDTAATGYNEDMEMYHSMASSNYDPLAKLSESERAEIIAKQGEETLSARERLERRLAERGVDIDLDVHDENTAPAAP